MNIKTFSENLITGLVNDEALSKILLKMQVIVDGLDNEALKIWMGNELNGYTNRSDVPTYRKTPCELHIDVSKPFGMVINNYNLPIEFIKDELARKTLSEIIYTQSIVELEKLSMSSIEQTIAVSVPGYLYGFINKSLYSGSNLLAARQVTTPATIDAILVKFRSILLQMILDINKELPEKANLDVLLQPKMGKVAENIVINAGILQTGNGKVLVENSTVLGGHDNICSVNDELQEQILEIAQKVSKLETNIKADESDIAATVWELQDAVRSKEQPSKLKMLLRALVSIPTVAADELIRIGIGKIINQL